LLLNHQYNYFVVKQKITKKIFCSFTQLFYLWFLNFDSFFRHTIV